MLSWVLSSNGIGLKRSYQLKHVFISVFTYYIPKHLNVSAWIYIQYNLNILHTDNFQIVLHVLKHNNICIVTLWIILEITVQGITLYMRARDLLSFPFSLMWIIFFRARTFKEKQCCLPGWYILHTIYIWCAHSRHFINTEYWKCNVLIRVLPL